jgi:hypothetical protein
MDQLRVTGQIPNHKVSTRQRPKLQCIVGSFKNSVESNKALNALAALHRISAMETEQSAMIVS